MKTFYSTLTVAVFLLIFLSGLHAQAPQKIDYQAIARESDGQPIAEQTVGVQLSILKGPLPGTLVYQERHLVNTDRFGLFTLGIGTGNVQSGNFSGIDWSAGQHFIQIEIDKNGGSSFVNMGTFELMSVPYALYAERSGTSEKPDHDWADTYLRFEKPDGSWGIYVDLQGEQGPEGPQGNPGPEGPQGDPGTTSWNGLNDIPAGFADNTDDVNDADASTTNEKINSISLSASNILSITEPDNTKSVDLSSLSGGSALWTQNGNKIYYNNGNVGIGTTNPSQLLEVKNGIIKSSGSLSSGFYAQGNANEGFWSYDNPGHGIRAHMNGGYGIYSDENDDGAAYFDGDVHIVGDSKVGIGVSDPEAKLAVGGIGDNRHAIHGESSENNGVGIHGEVSGLNGVGGSFRSTNGIGVIVNGYTHDIYASGSGNNYFAGKVGIGTLYPNAKLAVDGNVEVSGELHSQNTGSNNMMPFAYGRISSSGAVLVSTDNVTSQKLSTGLYNVVITSLGGNSGYIVLATGNNSNYNISIDPKSGNFDVYSRNISTGSYGDSHFYFTVYKK